MTVDEANQTANTTFADQTLVEDERKGDVSGSGQTTTTAAAPAKMGHARGESAATTGSKIVIGDLNNLKDSGPQSPIAFASPTTPWGRPQRQDSADEKSEGLGLEEKGGLGGLQDTTVIVESGGDIVDSKGRLLYPDEDSDVETGLSPGTGGLGSAIKPSPVGSRRASHLRLDLKPPSPQPWEQIDPPLDNNLKAIAGYYSPAGSTKFRTLQDAGGPRPLIPKSSYYSGPPPPDSAYGTAPVGQIGVHHPREILRVERDYTGGEVIQFTPIYPLELDGRITPTQFLESINAINELLISAHSLRHSMLDHMLAIFTLQLSRLVKTSHFDKEMQRLQRLVEELNSEVFNPVGLNILWPRSVAFLYLEIEYY